MPYEVKLPDIGEGVAEGEIVRWLVRPGDLVREEQPLVEVMTDKASVEIPSPRAGKIAALNAEEGQVLKVGSVLLTIALAGDAAGGAAGAPGAAHPAARAAAGATGASEPAASAPGLGPRAGSAAATAAPAGRVAATPAVRQLAKRLGVALEALSGTGPGGMVTAADVERAAAGLGASVSPAAAAP